MSYQRSSFQPRGSTLNTSTAKAPEPAPAARSDIRKSSVLRNSQTPTTTTPAAPTEARKWLGKNPEVVTFVMALELNRVQDENDQLRIIIKDLEANSQGGDAKSRELQDKLDRALKELERITKDNQQLKTDNDTKADRIRQLEKDLADYKKQFGAQQDQQINDLKKLLAQKDKEIADWKSKYDKDIADWKKRYAELEDRMKKDGSSQADLKNQIAALTKQLNEAKQENGKLQKIIDDLNKQLKTLQDRLASGDGDKKGLQDQIADWKAKYQQLQKDIEKLQNEIKGKDNEIAYLKQQLAMAQENEGKLQVKLTEKDQKIQDKQNEILDLKSEIDRLKQQLKDAEKKGDQQSGEVQKIQDEVNRLNQEIEDLKNQLNDKDVENQKLQNAIQDLNNKIKSLSEENQKLNQLARDRLKALMDLQVKNAQLEAQIQQLQNVQARNKQLEDRIADLLAQLEELKKRVQNQDLELLEARGAALRQAELEKRIEALNAEIDRLRQQVSDQQQNIKAAEDHIADLEKDLRKIKDLEGVIESLQRKIENQTADIGQLRDVLHDREEELLEWKRKYAELEPVANESKQFENKLRFSENRNQALVTDNEALGKQFREAQQKVDQDQWTISQLEGQVQGRTDALGSLQNRLNGLQQEYDAQRQLVIQLEGQLSGLKQLEDKAQQQEIQIKNLSSEIARLNKEIENLHADNEQLRQNISQQETQIQDFKQNEARLVEVEKQHEKLVKEHEDLVKAYNEAEAHINALETDIKGLNQEKETLQQQLVLQDDRVKQLAQKAAQYQQQFEAADHELVQLKLEIEKLQAILKQREEELNDFHTIHPQLEDRIAYLTPFEAKFNAIAPEFDQNVELLQKQQEELDDIHHRLADYNDLARQIDDLSAQNKALNSQLQGNRFATRKDYYSILGVEKSATAEQIKEAYVQKAKILYPEVRSQIVSLDNKVQREFQDVAEAYAVLSQLQSRNSYDLSNKLQPNLVFAEEQEQLLKQQIRNDDGTYQKPGVKASAYAQQKIDYLKEERDLFNVDQFGHYKGGLPGKDRQDRRGKSLMSVGMYHRPFYHNMIQTPFEATQTVTSEEVEHFKAWSAEERIGKEWSYLYQVASVDYEYFKFHEYRMFWRWSRNFFIFFVAVPFLMASYLRTKNRYFIQEIQETIQDGISLKDKFINGRKIVITPTGTLRFEAEKQHHH